jgi:nuclear cap-binding protein subunit 2
MAELFALEDPGKIYWDRKSFATFEDHVNALRGSKYLYIGNLSFYTTEAQIIELFSKVSKKV